MASNSDNTKRLRGRPKTTGTGLLVGVRLKAPDVSQLDAWIAAQPNPKPTRPEAIRVLSSEALSARGPVGLVETSADLTHEIRALENSLASIPAGTEQSPEAALHTMDRAIAENDLVDLRHKRKRVRAAKPKPSDGEI